VASVPNRAAAVPYRVEGTRVEFLLVRTSDRRAWTFPKGTPDRSDRGLAGTALREACEEAGVHGAIDERSLPPYRYPHPSGADRVVAPFLLHVLSQHRPHGGERGREPTWVAPDEARRLLADGRDALHAAEHDRVVTEALARVGERSAGD
jgi:8-oxo-dGTP pyrophosphatase MutT (NUDIX family)